MSLGGLFQQPVVWSLTSLDDGTVIEGQFRPTGLTENISAVFAEHATLGHSTPVIQFVRGGLGTIRFQAKCHAYSQGLFGTSLGKMPICDIEDQVALIKSLPMIDENLGRPHVWQFTVGNSFQQTVVCRTVGGVRYDHMRPSDGGSLRGVLFDIELLKYVPIGGSDTPNESLIYITKSGDDFETIATNVYGRPLLGEALRRRNPDKRYLESGDRIHVPPEDILDDELTLEPQSTQLKRTDSATELFDATLVKRAGPYYAGILGNEVY